MIAACPKCGARYRIEDGRLGPQGARLRCARCEAIFRVRAPQPNEASQRSVEAAPQPPAAQRSLVLIADPDPETGRETLRTLDSLGVESVLVHDGVQAILEIQRKLPRIVVLDRALPKMLGSQVCEVLKRNESLRRIHVILIEASHGSDERPEAHGADAYLERAALPQGLVPILRRLGVEMTRPREAPEPPPEPSPEVPVRPPVAPVRAAPPTPASSQASRVAAGPGREASRAPVAAPPADSPDIGRAGHAPAAPSVSAGSESPSEPPDGLDPMEVAKAQRLARIVISDIVLYNAAKFEMAVRRGDVLERMRDELADGRSLFRQRIDARVRESSDFLGEEMLRVARERGAK